MLQQILDFAHTLMHQSVSKGDIVVDGTCGNGHDTLFLTELVGDNGHVYGFDIQQDAITKTKQRLKDHSRDSQATLFHASHANLRDKIPAKHQSMIQGAIFNLGYLPGGDKSIVTTPDETIESIQSLLSLLNKEGLIVLVIYHGHSGGKEEKEAILDFVKSLEQHYVRVLQYGFINQKNSPPFIIALEKQ